MFTSFNIPVINLNTGDWLDVKLQGADNRGAHGNPPRLIIFPNGYYRQQWRKPLMQMVIFGSRRLYLAPHRRDLRPSGNNGTKKEGLAGLS
jgi:hypothetical protein